MTVRLMAWSVIGDDGSLFTSRNATADRGIFGYIAESEVAAKAHARPGERVVPVEIVYKEGK